MVIAKVKLKKAPKKEELSFRFTCQKCAKRKETTRRRTIYTKNYVGGCGDSFCYAGCDSSSCKPIEVTVCDGCAEKLEKKP